MFKPNPSAVRTLSRSFTCRQIFSGARRRLHTRVQNVARPRTTTLFAAAAGIAAGVMVYQTVEFGKVVHADASPAVFQGPASSLSLQHLQVEKALENPGVYVWGDNSGKVIAPDSKEKVIKTPRRLKFFDGQLLRDLQLSQDVGVAVNDKGDVLMWGNGYAPETKQPEPTLTGKNIEKVIISKDKIVALSKDKQVYTFPISKSYQQEGLKPTETSWIPGRSSTSDISYRIIKPELGYLERIKDIAAGREHALLLTSDGRVFSSAVAFTYPTRGQLGIPELTWTTRPTDKPVDTPHEITELKGKKVDQIAAGDYHSVVLTKDGEVYTFGDNVHGQLGFEYTPDTNFYGKPKLLLLTPLYPASTAKVTNINAGGMNTYFEVDKTDNESGRSSSEVLSCGTGIHGNLGNGRWTHMQGTPTKIKALSNMQEFDEATNKVQPIRLRDLSAGATHCAATMSTSTSSNEYGSDVLFWGNNEFYQLGTGKRNNSASPIYIQPLDGVPTEFAPKTEDAFTGSSNRADVGRASGLISSLGNQDETGNARVTIGDQVHRFQVANEGKVNGKGRAEQTVVCGRGNTAVYMKKV
ncbi:mitochondrial protein-like protein Fmp25 [Sphaerosporella brunnea]|uniref:Mitochondrial protein-like protein Fmp25 n=1 Tax=Sphaerosporella brunnea TaxID=1250544 RepID=A0A5J5F9T2_9PEZI|nr:mitochondrial protein-like protein Fmp25 [Sphaerosporella brunnea]